MLNVGKYTIQMVWDMYQTINSEKAIHFNPLVSGSYAAEQLGIMDKDLIFGAANVFIVCQRGLLDNNRYFCSISYCINIFLFVCLFGCLVVLLCCCVVVLLCCCVVLLLLLLLFHVWVPTHQSTSIEAMRIHQLIPTRTYSTGLTSSQYLLTVWVDHKQL